MISPSIADDEDLIDGKRQFRALYRDFLRRVVDPELLSASGEMRNLLVQFAALVAAYNFVLALFVVPHFGLSRLSHAKLLVSAWGVEEFLISSTLTVAGMFSVLAWNSFLPEKRDCYVLAPLPMRSRTIFFAKIAAIVTAIAVSIIAVNVFTGLSFPFLVIPSGAGIFGGLRAVVAYWCTMLAAGGFILSCVAGMQYAAAVCFGYRFFQRVSGLLQVLTFFAVLALFFLTPSLATSAGLSDPANQRLLAFLPSFWFLGLFQVLNGAAESVFYPLAVRGALSFLTVLLFLFGGAAIGYRRTMRSMIEQPDIAPGERGGGFTKIAVALVTKSLVDPIDRAILLFSARTLGRSRQHRLFLSVYVGAALALSLAFAKSLLYGTSAQRWDEPNVPLITASLVMLFFATLGGRAVFALPFALPANWIFRMSAVRSPGSYFSAARKSLFILVALPVLVAAAFGYLAIWPGRPALEHLLVLVLLSVLLNQTLLRKFRKIPFACSYLPGKANLRLKLGIAGFSFLWLVDMAAHIELWSFEKTARYAWVAGLLMCAAIWAKRHTAEFANSPYNRIQFEDIASPEIHSLDLRRDSEHLNESDFLDVVSAPPARPFRLMRYGLGIALLLTAGLAYERFGEWRDEKTIPRVGRLVNVGSHALNLFCAGTGSPTVVMDSGGGVPGYGWAAVEPGVAKLTRACWYDRAGYGWSDPARGPRSAADVAEDLHMLLHAAEIAPPYLLVGHSVGGFHVRVFAARYGVETAGLVLVDSADEFEDASRLPKSMQSAVNGLPEWLRRIYANSMRMCFRLGLARLIDNGVSEAEGKLTLQETSIVHTLQLQPKEFEAVLAEGAARRDTLAQVRAIRSLGNLPLIVLSGAKKPAVQLSDREEEEMLDRFMEQRVHGTQARLAALSTQGRQIILDNVGHAIPTEAPEAVVDAVRDLLAQIRQRAK